MGRGGCNCCGDWVTTAKIAKTSGALLWNYNYGMDTFNILPVGDNIYVVPRGLYGTGNGYYSNYMNLQYKKSDGNDIYINMTHGDQENFKNIDVDGEYLGGTRHTLFSRLNYINNVYNFRKSTSLNQKRSTSQCNNNRCLLSLVTHTIFEKDVDSAKNINEEGETLFDRKINIVPKYAFAPTYSNARDYFYDEYFYSNNTSYYNSIGSEKFSESANNRLIYLDTDSILRYNDFGATNQNESIKNITYDDNNRITFDIDYQSVNHDVLFNKFSFMDITYVSGIATVSTLRTAIVTNISPDNNTANTRLLIGTSVDEGWHIEFDNSGYTFSPNAGLYPDPIYQSLVINSFDMGHDFFSASLSFDVINTYESFAIQELLNRFKRLYRYDANITYDVYDNGNTYVRTDVKNIRFDLNNGNPGDVGRYHRLDVLDIDADPPVKIFDFNSLYYNYRDSISVFNLQSQTSYDIYIEDLINQTDMYQDIASEYGYDIIDIRNNPLPNTYNITLTQSQLDDIASGNLTVLDILGLNNGILGLYIYRGDRDSTYYDYAADYNKYPFYNSSLKECLKVGYDERHYGIFSSVFHLMSVRYKTLMSQTTTTYSPVPSVSTNSQPNPRLLSLKPTEYRVPTRDIPGGFFGNGGVPAFINMSDAISISYYPSLYDSNGNLVNDTYHYYHINDSGDVILTHDGTEYNLNTIGVITEGDGYNLITIPIGSIPEYIANNLITTSVPLVTPINDAVLSYFPIVVYGTLSNIELTSYGLENELNTRILTIEYKDIYSELKISSSAEAFGFNGINAVYTPSISAAKDYTVILEYTISVFKRLAKSFKLLFDIDGQNATYKFLNLDARLGFKFNPYYNYYSHYEYYLDSYEDILNDETDNPYPIYGFTGAIISEYYPYEPYRNYGYGRYEDGYAYNGYNYGLGGHGYDYDHFGRYNTDREFINIEKSNDVVFAMRDEDYIKESLSKIKHKTYKEAASLVVHMPLDGGRNIDYSVYNFANPLSKSVIIPIDSDYMNIRHITSSGTPSYNFRWGLPHIVYDYVNTGASGQLIQAFFGDYTSSSNIGGSYDIVRDTNNSIAEKSNTVTVLNDVGDFVSGHYIPRPVCMTKGDDDSVYIGMCTTSNRVAIYTGIQNIPTAFDSSYFIKDESEISFNYAIDISQESREYYDGFNDWAAGIDTSRAYAPKECIWLVPDFNRETIDIENSKSVRVYIQDKYFELKLLDTAEDIKNKVIALGYTDIYVYGGPIIDRPVCIAGFNTVEFTKFIPHFATNDSLGRYITSDNTAFYDLYSDYYSAYNPYFYTVYYYNGEYNLELLREDYRFSDYNSISTAGVNIIGGFSKPVTKFPSFHTRILNSLIEEYAISNDLPYIGASAEDRVLTSQEFYNSRSGKSIGTLSSQDGFILPAVKFLDGPEKITYDFNITTDEFIQSQRYPEVFDIDYVTQASGNMSIFFHHGLMCKVENSTTGFKSKQAALLKVNSNGEIDWTTDYGYEPFIQTKDSSGIPLTNTIEKNVHFNGKIQDIKYHSGEVYITGNMINLDAIAPKSFNDFSDYYNNVILQRFEISQKKRIPPNYGFNTNTRIFDVLGENHEVAYESFKIQDLNDPK